MPKLFYDDECDALAQTIANSERSFKECAAFLFPHLKPESQYARLKNCIRADKPDESLSFSQIIALCKFCSQADALHFMADELNHERPSPRAPEDEAKVLQQEFIAGVKRLEAIGAKLERLTQSPLATVRNAA